MRKTYCTILEMYSVRQRSIFLLLRIVREAIAYRIPRPVVKVIQYHSGDVYPVCPRCNCSLDREYAAFCDRCGQRLGWSALDQAEVIRPMRADLLRESDETPAAISDTQHPEYINWRSRLGQNSIGK